MIAILALIAATLTFQNTSTETLWFSVVQIVADSAKPPVAYVRSHPNPGTVGAVTIDLPGSPGDCFFVTAIDRDGPSPWSNRACLAGNVPAQPTGADAK